MAIAHNQAKLPHTFFPLDLLNVFSEIFFRFAYPFFSACLYNSEEQH
jgi:hypothetical protein